MPAKNIFSLVLRRFHPLVISAADLLYRVMNQSISIRSQRLGHNSCKLQLYPVCWNGQIGIDTVWRKKVIRELVIADAVLFGSLVVAAFVFPTTKVETYGISYYLVHLRTFLIVATGFLLCDAIVWHVLRLLPGNNNELKWMRKTLVATAVLMIGVLATPYTLDTFFNWAHMILGAALFIVQLTYALWLAWDRRRDLMLWSFVTVQILSGISAMLSLPNDGLHFLIQGEVVFQVAFSLILIHGLHSVAWSGTPERIDLEGNATPDA
jgi:hypothetical protein